MIKIKDNFYVRVSELNFTALEKRKAIKKNGEEVDSYKTIGYYGSLINAIKGIREYKIEIELDTEEDIELQDAIDIIDRIKEEFKAVLERHIKEG